jgi:cystathionine beta-lyase
MPENLAPLVARPLAELRTRKSEKWRGFPSDVLPLPVAEMDFEIAAPVRSLLTEMIAKSDTGYLGTIPELGVNFADFAKRRWSWDLAAEDVHIATDVGVGMVEVSRTILTPGDKILINTPVYHNFRNWSNELKCEVVDVPFIRTDSAEINSAGVMSEPTYEWDFENVEAAYASGVKVHFLCNPHNPLGKTFTIAELTKLVELAKEHGVIILSDEIHAPLAYSASPTAFTPILALGEAAQEVAITVTAASKSWNLAGLKAAVIIASSPRTRELLKKMPMAVHYRASLFGAFAAATAFTCTDWLDSALLTLDSNRKLVKQLLAEHLPAAGYRIPDNSYLAWIDLSKTALGGQEAEPAEIILKQARVAFNPGSAFSASHRDFVRLNFGTSPEIIEAAISKMAALVK